MLNHYQVAVNFPKMQSVLTYTSADEYAPGSLVEVPLGRRKSTGIILKKSTPGEIEIAQKYALKDISQSLEGSYNLSDQEFELFDWMSKYYHYPLGKLVFDSLPKILKRPRKVDFFIGDNKVIPFKLTFKQEEVVDKISHYLKEGFSRHYLHGITGSGKSFVYLRLMKEVISSGKSVQFLLPEINLTPQFINLFKEYLDCEIYSFHSGVTPSEKYTIYKNLKESKKPVLVMGVRSSVFLPIENLGLIIVDEEHDQSFKQSDRCPYNGRDVALKKAQIHNIPILMGSATPSLENFYYFKNKIDRRHYYSLTDRVGDGALPKLILKDTKGEFSENDPLYPLLPETIEEIRERLDAGEQVLVFINKLGFSNFLQCRNCGYQFKNKNCGCDNNLRYFKKRNYLSCAHCDFKMPTPDKCTECGSLSILTKGFGTEKVQEVLQTIFKTKVIERFDRDEIITLKDLNHKLDRFHDHKIDILVGTQMLSKGHNFKKVNLVVILGVDQMLNFADFRASERAYQLTEQVMGRAGRYSDHGEVIIQTMMPEHPIFEYLALHKFDSFYFDELKFREISYCPPYSRIIMIFMSSRFRDRVISIISKEGMKLRQVIMEHFPSVSILGPTSMMIEKKANQYTWGIMLKSNNIQDLHLVIKTFINNYEEVSGVSLKVDVDPQIIL